MRSRIRSSARNCGGGSSGGCIRALTYLLLPLAAAAVAVRLCSNGLDKVDPVPGGGHWVTSRWRRYGVFGG